MRQLSQRIRARAKALGGAEALAETAGLARSTVFSLIAGEHEPSTRTLAKLRLAGVRVRLSDFSKAA